MKTTLHIIQSIAGLRDAVAYIAKQDVLLLTQDSVYAAVPGHTDYALLHDKVSYVLDADAKARAIMSLLSREVVLATFGDFVCLTAEHDTSITWA